MIWGRKRKEKAHRVVRKHQKPTSMFVSMHENSVMITVKTLGFSEVSIFVTRTNLDYICKYKGDKQEKTRTSKCHIGTHKQIIKVGIV